MINLKIKIKAENKTHIVDTLLNDDYIVAKSNESLQKLVEKACKESRLEVIEDVIITAKFEW